MAITGGIAAYAAGAGAGYTGAALAIGTVAGAAAGYSIDSSRKQRKDAKRAAERVQQQNTAAIKSAKDQQASASTRASDVIKARRGGATRTVFTNPLGISGQANVNRKTLLGQ